MQFGATFAKLKGLESAGQRGIIIFVPSLRLSERTLLGFLLSLDKKRKSGSYLGVALVCATVLD